MADDPRVVDDVGRGVLAWTTADPHDAVVADGPLRPEEAASAIVNVVVEVAVEVVVVEMTIIMVVPDLNLHASATTAP